MFGAGEAGALGAAFLWACSSVIFGGARLTAWQINSCKNLVGCLLVLSTLLVSGIFTGTFFSPIPLWAVGWLAMSGIVGLSIGDTLYFRSLQILGPRKALVMSTFTPLFGALLGWWIVGESITFFSAMAIPVAIAGISMAIAGRQQSKEAPGLYPGRAALGILAGIGAALCQAFGGAISKVAMEHCSALEATFYRLFIAVIVAFVVMVAGRQLDSTLTALRKRENLVRIIAAATIGTWLGIWCSQIGFKYSSVAVASTLQVTSPLFSIPIIWLVYRHRVSRIALLGNVIAIIGVLMVLAGSWDQILQLLGLGESMPADPNAGM